MRDLIYLASPYSHPDDKVRETRFWWACHATTWLIREEGLLVFSPIVHSHHLAVDHGMSLGYDDWADYDEGMMDHCEQLTVLKLDGWKDSDGVRAEIEYMRRAGKKVSYLDPMTLVKKP